jgi:hypothetical protein
MYICLGLPDQSMHRLYFHQDTAIGKVLDVAFSLTKQHWESMNSKNSIFLSLTASPHLPISPSCKLKELGTPMVELTLQILPN